MSIPSTATPASPLPAERSAGAPIPGRAVGRAPWILALLLLPWSPAAISSTAALMADEAPEPDLATLFAPHAESPTVEIENGPWAELLEKHLRQDESGLAVFDYAAVDETEKAALDAYVSYLEGIRPETLDRDQQMAFWANLYNAATVREMLRHWPIETILDIALPPAEPGGGPWDARLLEVAGQSLSLNDVEHRILRPIWRDARIHYMVNCASMGCPNLPSRPWTAEDLDTRLDRAAREFVSHARAVRFENGADGQPRQLVLSSLYDWYSGDFGSDRIEVLEHLADHAEGRLGDLLEDYAGPITYDYDWAVNAP